MKQSIDPKLAAAILLLALTAGLFWWRGTSRPRAQTATGAAGMRRHIKPGAPSADSNPPLPATRGIGM